jgi:hypothetical protein
MTETEIVALISAGAAIVGAGLSALVTYAVTSRQIAAAQALAKDDRVQERRAQAYLELFEHVARLNSWITFVMAADQQGTSSAIGKEPTLIDEDRWYTMISLCRAFGSRPVLSTFTLLHQKTFAISISVRNSLRKRWIRFGPNQSSVNDRARARRSLPRPLLEPSQESEGCGSRPAIRWPSSAGR